MTKDMNTLSPAKSLLNCLPLALVDDGAGWFERPGSGLLFLLFLGLIALVVWSVRHK